MTHTTNDAPVTVEQCDREAAWPFAPCAGTAADIAGGRGDWLPVVQAFARHRLAALASAPAGWIVGNGDGTKWRTWENIGPVWTEDRNKATRYARREDAEAVHAEDEDAWTIQPYVAAGINYESALFDVLETLKAHYPQIAGGFARGTGGFDRDYILDELRKPAPAPAGDGDDEAASAYVAEYVMSTEGADYEPTDWERELIEDALHGFLSERSLDRPRAAVGVVDRIPDGQTFSSFVEGAQERGTLHKLGWESDSPHAAVGEQSREAIEAECAALIATYYRREIGTLMQQAEHWAENGKPLAVHHRVMKADDYFQIVCQMERDPAKGWKLPFDEIRDALGRKPSKDPGTYPPSKDLYRYRDPAFVVAALQSPPAK